MIPPHKQNRSILYYDFLQRRFRPLALNHKSSSSLYSRFRTYRHFLSVSDLISCVWCQFQVEYGLLGKRYLPPAKRPKSFTTSSRKRIRVDMDMVLSRQKILDGGKRVHAQLEKEVAPEPVRVQTVTRVDEWGLKVIKTIVNLSLLRSTGMMREINVWGFVGDFLVQGIIDQIDLIPIAPADDQSSSDEDHDEESPVQTCISSGTASPIQEPSKCLVARISDSKTIETSTLPPPEHTETPRYQLMLYKYLHDQNASGNFDLDKFGARLNLNLEQTFSAPFVSDIEQLLEKVRASFDEKEGEDFTNPNTLRNMFKLYDRMIRMVGVSDETLEIVYRRRDDLQKSSTDGTEPKKRKLNLDQPVIKTNPLESTTTTPSPPTSEEVKASSNADSTCSTVELDAKGAERLIQGPDSPTLDKSIETGTKQVSPEMQRFNYLDPNDIENIFSKFSTAEKMRGHINEDMASKAKVVGRYEFEFHPIEFLRFIWEAVRFWNGDQDPVGVDIEEFNKCDTCEFKNGCEWRSKMSIHIKP